MVKTGVSPDSGGCLGWDHPIATARGQADDAEALRTVSYVRREPGRGDALVLLVGEPTRPGRPSLAGPDLARPIAFDRLTGGLKATLPDGLGRNLG